MRTIVHLYPHDLADPESLARLAALAATDELILRFGSAGVTAMLVRSLRAALGRHRLVALLVNGEVSGDERRLVLDLLDEGNVPLIVVTGDQAPDRLTNWLWLGADRTITLSGTTGRKASGNGMTGGGPYVLADGSARPDDGSVTSVSRRLPRGNLPAELNSFVGRRHELTQVRRLLAANRLVTLVGAGGVGKSRLALHAAREAARAFRDGVWLVELASLNDAVLLPRAVSEAVGLTDQTARNQTEVLASFLASRHLLLVVDNCEHLLPGCAALIADLLAAAPDLKVLVTSREVLHLFGEQVYQVEPLAVPPSDPPVRSSADAGGRYPALELFADRAAAAGYGLTITEDNWPYAVRICRRLDGIPLAIELAASRLRALSLQQLVSMLDNRFDLLTQGNRTALPRHRTLWAAVEWSFELCTKPERLLWARASVFAGSFDLDAAEHVCGGDGLPGDDVREALAGLIDKSVLVVENDDVRRRYRFLDTLREYGLHRLRFPDDADESCGIPTVGEPQLRRRHLAFYAQLAERFDADWFGPRQVEWTERMCAELPNLRAALGLCVDNPDQTRSGLRLAGALYYLWYGCGEIREGRWWLERLLAAHGEPAPERIRALAVYGRLLILQGVPAAAAQVARECLELIHGRDDPFHESHTLQTLGLAEMYLDAPESASALLRRAVDRASELGSDHAAVAFTTFALAVAALLIDDDPVRSAGLFAESRAICRAHGDRWWLGNVLSGSIQPELRLGDTARAEAYGREALAVRTALHDPQGAAAAVDMLAWVAAATGDHRRAARLLGAADRYWRSVGGSPFGAGQWLDAHKRSETSARNGLGPRFEVEYRHGEELSLDDATSYALRGERSRPSRPPTGPALDQPHLTPRELQVAELVAEGLTNRQIATRLMISQRTAESHVENILLKLNLTSRVQIVAWHMQRRPNGTGGGE